MILEYPPKVILSISPVILPPYTQKSVHSDLGLRHLLPTIEVFDILILWPEIVLKIIRLSFNFRIWDSSALRKHSVIRKLLMADRKVFLANKKAFNNAPIFSMANNSLRSSATNVNRKCYNGSSCLRPLDDAKKPFEVPFNKMEKWG